MDKNTTNVQKLVALCFSSPSSSILLVILYLYPFPYSPHSPSHSHLPSPIFPSFIPPLSILSLLSSLRSVFPFTQSPSVSYCVNHTQCEEGYVPEGGNGPFTGHCNETTNTCMIRAWCPVEEENENITYVVQDNGGVVEL